MNTTTHVKGREILLEMLNAERPDRGLPRLEKLPEDFSELIEIADTYYRRGLENSVDDHKAKVAAKRLLKSRPEFKRYRAELGDNRPKYTRPVRLVSSPMRPGRQGEVPAVPSRADQFSREPRNDALAALDRLLPIGPGQ